MHCKRILASLTVLNLALYGCHVAPAGIAPTGSGAAITARLIDSTISGQVKDARGNLVAGAIVRAVPVGSGPDVVPYVTVSDEAGRFTLGVPGNATYNLVFESDRLKQTAIKYRVMAGTSTADIDLTPTSSITGTVADPAGDRTPKGALVYLPGTSFVAVAKEDGTFTMTGVPVGTYTALGVSLPGYAPKVTTGSYVVSVATPLSGVQLAVDVNDALGFTAKGAFTAGQSYNVNDIVTHEGAVYRAKVAVANALSGDIADNTKFELWAAKGTNGTNGAAGADGADGKDGADGTGFKAKGAFTAGDDYLENDVVTHEGAVYRAKVDVTDALIEDIANATKFELWAAKGDQGDPGSHTAHGFFYNFGGGAAVLKGELLPLGENGTGSGSGFMRGANPSVITVAEAGKYLIRFNVAAPVYESAPSSYRILSAVFPLAAVRAVAVVVDPVVDAEDPAGNNGLTTEEVQLDSVTLLGSHGSYTGQTVVNLTQPNKVIALRSVGANAINLVNSASAVAVSLTIEKY